MVVGGLSPIQALNPTTCDLKRLSPPASIERLLLLYLVEFDRMQGTAPTAFEEALPVKYKKRSGSKEHGETCCKGF